MSIFDNPATVAAAISSCIALTGIVIQTILTVSKNKNEVRSNFEKVLSEKLKEMYTPLQMLLQKNKSSTHLIDTDAEVLLMKYNHLLSNDLQEDIFQLVQLENRIRAGEGYSEEEHQSLKEKVLILCKEEFSELQSIQNRHFDRYKKRFNTTWWDRTSLISFITIISLTIIFWIVVLLTPSFQHTGEWWKPLVVGLVVMIVVGTFMLLVAGTVLLIALFEYIKSKFKKKKTAFIPKNYVPETNIYKCTICSNEVRKVKYQQFGECDRKHSWIQNLFAFLTIYSWKLARVKSIKSIVQQDL